MHEIEPRSLPAIDNVVVIACTGWLDSRQIAWLNRRLMQAIRHGARAVIIEGTRLRYRHVRGLALLDELLEQARNAYPAIPVCLCHLAPDILGASQLADIGQTWLTAPDLATAHRILSSNQEKG